MQNRKKVLVFLLKGFETLEFSAFIDVLGWATQREQNIIVKTCGFTKIVSSTFNIKITVDQLINEIDIKEYDAIAIPGGFEEFGFYEEAYNKNLLNLITQFNAQGKIIATVCSGVFPIAKSGILKKRKATTYHLGNGYWQKKLKDFDINVINEPIVIDNNVITSHSPSTAPYVAFELLKMLTTEEIMTEVKINMGYQNNLQ